MSYKVSKKNLEDLLLTDADETKEILRNVALIVNTYEGSVPMYREIGMSSDIVHRPVNIVKTLLLSDLSEKVRKFEPRATVLSVDVSSSTEDPSNIEVIVEVDINE